MNRITLMGRAGRDAESKSTQKGTMLLTFSLATSEKRDEGYQTEWHTVNVWGKSAEMLQGKIRKGSEVFVDGKLTYNKWTDKQGQQRVTAQIQAFYCRVTTPEKDTEHFGEAETTTPTWNPPTQEEFKPAFTEEDIPF